MSKKKKEKCLVYWLVLYLVKTRRTQRIFSSYKFYSFGIILNKVYHRLGANMQLKVLRYL